METITQVKNRIKEIKDVVTDDKDYIREIIESMANDEDDFYVNDYRFISKDAIDEIMVDELLSDEYFLGCCSAWFIADMTDLDISDVEKAQKDENFTLLGCLMAKNIKEVQEEMVSLDGYGHHFNHYDGNEEEIGNYYVFRSN